jgi:DNA mismatch repair ATPase MutS
MLAGVLARLERERFGAAGLQDLRAALHVEGHPASRRIARLARLQELVDSRRNMLLAPLAALWMSGTLLAVALERWRRRSGPAVGAWLEAVGRFEALAALAGLAWERPGDPFPTLAAGGPRFEAEGLGHPLLPDEACVRNDVKLAAPLALLIVSGSNMSGKSTLLRAVGINVVLAQAGGPVCARRLELSPLTLGTCLHVHDSLRQGTSQFMAEITRLRRLLDAGSASRPLLFLLDEVLHGTNSHDRRLGAEALIRQLLARGAAGLVTTHDLALAAIAESLEPAVANVHFEDQLRDGRPVFDYRLRPGVVRRGNALALMRSVGFEV